MYTYVHHGIEIIELAARHLQNVKNKWHQFIWGNLSCDKPFQTFYLDSLLCLYLCFTVCICTECLNDARRDKAQFLQSPGLGWSQHLSRPGAFFSIFSSRREREWFTNCWAVGSRSMFSRLESLSLTLDQFLIHARTFWNRT